MTYDGIVRGTYRKFFIPTAISTMSIAVMNLLNILFAGLFFGNGGSYVVGLALPVVIFSSIITYFFGVGGGIAISIRQGRGDRREAGGLFTAAVTGTVVLGAAAAVLGGLGAGLLLPVLGAKTAAEQALAGGYLRILFLGMPGVLLCGVLNVILRNDNQPKLAMAGTLVSILSNLALLGLFIGVLRLPVWCIALATVLSNTLCALVYLGYFFFGKSTLKFQRVPFCACIREIAQPGFAGSMIFLTQTILTVVINNILLAVGGAAGIAAYGVVKYVITLIYAVYDSINDSAQPMFSVYYGERDQNSIRLTAKTAGRFLLAAVAALCAGLWLLAPLFSRLFSLEVTGAVRTIGAACLFSGAVAFLNSVYRATGRAWLSLIFTALDNLLLPVVLIYVLTYGLGMGVAGVWAALALAELLTLGLMALTARGNLLRLGGMDTPPEKVYQTLILNDEANIVAITEEIQAFCRRNEVDEKKQYYILLCLEEIAVNIIHYGFRDGREHYIDIRIVAGGNVLLNIRDDAIQFDPTAKVEADVTSSAEERDIGGLGIYLVKKVAKEFSYKRVIGFNNLHIVL